MTRQRKVLQAAKAYEQSGQDRDALELYQRLAREGEGSGATRLRIGDLELRLGDREAAGATFRAAVEAFLAVGQTHNALALCCRLLALDPGERGAARRLLQLAGSSGYARSARDAVQDHLLHGSGADHYQGALGLVHEYLEYFPADDAPARRWLEQAVADLGRESALGLLTTSWNEMRASAPPERAELFRTLLSEIDPQAARKSSATLDAADHARRGDGHSRAGSADRAPDRELPSASQVAADAAEIPLEPLAGFEPTNLTDLSDDGGPLEIEALPLLEHSAGWGAPEARPGEDRGPKSPTEALEQRRVPEPAREAPERVPTATADGSEMLSSDPDRGPALPDRMNNPGEWPSPPLAPDRERFATLVQGARRLTAHPVPAASSATHYDLALGYKEMEMLDEALAHSAAALEAGHSPLVLLELMGELLVERGHHLLANEALQLARTNAAASGGDLVNIYYWLARNEEALGRAEKARELLQRIAAIEPSFRDAALRLDRITSDPF